LILIVCIKDWCCIYWYSLSTSNSWYWYSISTIDIVYIDIFQQRAVFDIDILYQLLMLYVHWYLSSTSSSWYWFSISLVFYINYWCSMLDILQFTEIRMCNSVLPNTATHINCKTISTIIETIKLSTIEILYHLFIFYSNYRDFISTWYSVSRIDDVYIDILCQRAVVDIDILYQLLILYILIFSSTSSSWYWSSIFICYIDLIFCIHYYSQPQSFHVQYTG